MFPILLHFRYWMEFHNVLIAVQSNWLGNFALNLLGYALIIGPAALLIHRLKKNPLVERGCYFNIIVVWVQWLNK